MAKKTTKAKAKTAAKSKTKAKAKPKAAPKPATKPAATITVRPAIKQSVDKVEVRRWVDIPGRKIVQAVLVGIPMPVVIYSGEAYDAAGEWTRVKATNRLKAILAGTKKATDKS